ncbi:hydroxyisourate hydrolase [Jiella marina]|uniref:hydroxyisourate hydrolase n=1 Tax=Jiella sp. LLJ827 TaxID=2917712 RepID=UPI0021009256|nr:hydroxyisourate hydrolase [Jiella sp. LLJ827]MCQ0987933.1 hydroxyisourate hydrolase [Jiella sp. LLJ827]
MADPAEGRLTTHVLDTMHGCPAAGIRIELTRYAGESMEMVKSVETNDDGRVDQPLLVGADLVPGQYGLTFFVADYFRAKGVSLPEPAFLDIVPIRFGISTPAHYHVPLLISPYAYSTYRGS